MKLLDSSKSEEKHVLSRPFPIFNMISRGLMTASSLSCCESWIDSVLGLFYVNEEGFQRL